jgi:hypothetical protein
MKGLRPSSWFQCFNSNSTAIGEMIGHGKTKDKKCCYCHKLEHLHRDYLLLKKPNSKKTDKPNKHQSIKSTEKPEFIKSSVGANSIGMGAVN